MQAPEQWNKWRTLTLYLNNLHTFLCMHSNYTKKQTNKQTHIQIKSKIINIKKKLESHYIA